MSVEATAPPGSLPTSTAGELAALGGAAEEETSGQDRLVYQALGGAAGAVALVAVVVFSATPDFAQATGAQSAGAPGGAPPSATGNPFEAELDPPSREEPTRAVHALADGRAWDDAALTAFLAAPKGFMKGTKLAFAGLKKEGDQAAIIAYLSTFRDE